MSPKRIVPVVVLLALGRLRPLALRPRTPAPRPTASSPPARSRRPTPSSASRSRAASTRSSPQEGDRVAAGPELARLDRTELDARRHARPLAQVAGGARRARRARAGSRREEIAQARAALAAADERVRRRRARLRARAPLLAGGAVAREALDKAQPSPSTRRAASATRRPSSSRCSNRARAASASPPRAPQLAAGRGRGARRSTPRSPTWCSRAPFAGVVTVRHREPGEIVAAGSPVLTLMNRDDRWVRIYVPENRASARCARPAGARSPPTPSRASSYAGEVSFIASEAEFTPKNVQTTEERVKLVYAVKVRVTGDPGTSSSRACRPTCGWRSARERPAPRAAASRCAGSTPPLRRADRGGRARLRRSRPASCSGWSAPTAPARRRRCACWPACCARAPATRSIGGVSAWRATPSAVKHRPRLHVAALRPLRRPHGARRTSTSTPTSTEVPAGRAAGAARAALPLLEPRAVPGPAGRPALGRHEAEARALVRARPRAASAAARRADLRRRPGLAPRPLAHRARDGGARRHRGRQHRLPGRGRALRPPGAAAPAARLLALDTPGALQRGLPRRAARRARRPARARRATSRSQPAGRARGPRCSATGCTSPSTTPRGAPAARRRRRCAPPGVAASKRAPLEPSLEDVFIDRVAEPGGEAARRRRERRAPLPAPPDRGRGPRPHPPLRRLHRRRPRVASRSRRGEVFGFLGPNGAGKTTTIRCCRPAARRPRAAARSPASTCTRETRGDQAPHRLHVAALLALRRPHASRRTSPSSPASTACRARERAGAPRLGARDGRPRRAAARG